MARGVDEILRQRDVDLPTLVKSAEYAAGLFGLPFHRSAAVTVDNWLAPLDPTERAALVEHMVASRGEK